MIRATPYILGTFFALSTIILVCVGIALAWPGTFFDWTWHLYEARRAQLMPYRGWLGPGFLSLAVVFATASIGCFAKRKWGLYLAIAIFIVNGIGDLWNLFANSFTEGLVGIIAASVIVYWLTRQNVDQQFQRSGL